jgi:hypothetical protein
VINWLAIAGKNINANGDNGNVSAYSEDALGLEELIEGVSLPEKVK